MMRLAQLHQEFGLENFIFAGGGFLSIGIYATKFSVNTEASTEWSSVPRLARSLSCKVRCQVLYRPFD